MSRLTLDSAVARKVGAYDFRHNGMQHYADATADLRRLAALSGTRVSTIDAHYLNPTEKQARRMLGKREEARVPSSRAQISR